MLLSALLARFSLLFYAPSRGRAKKRGKESAFVLDSKKKSDKKNSPRKQKLDVEKKSYFSSGVTFLVKEYQQLLADALAITGIAQPAVELDWLTQHVQYKIQEFIQLLVRTRRRRRVPFFFSTTTTTGGERENSHFFFQPLSLSTTPPQNKNRTTSPPRSPTTSRSGTRSTPTGRTWPVGPPSRPPTTPGSATRPRPSTSRSRAPRSGPT